MNTAETTPTVPVVLTVSAAAERRRSIRTYLDDPVTQAEMDVVLREAGLAPSAWNLQPWRFVVVRDPETKARLAVAAYNQKQVLNAPAVVVLYTDMADTLSHVGEVVRPNASAEQGLGFRKSVESAFGQQTETQREAWGYAQGFIALGFLLLSAEAHGLATSPMAGFDPEAVKTLLGLPPNVRVPALVAVGHAAELGEPHHRHALKRIARVA